MSFQQTATHEFPETLRIGRLTIPNMAMNATRLFAERIAVHSETGEQISYAELESRTIAAARAFIAFGIGRGDRVAIWAPNSAEWIVATLGLQAAGAALVPLNTRLKGKEAAYILSASRARMLLTVKDFLETDYPALIAQEDLPDLEQTVLLQGSGPAPQLRWSDFLKVGSSISEREARARIAALPEDAVCDILFTSGTTGKPKGVVTTHAQNLRQYSTYSRTLGLTADDRELIINPFFHVFGYKAGWLIALMRGATVHPMALFDSETVLRRIEAERITYLPGPPTIFQSLLAARWQRYDLSSLRLSITGATSVPVELVRRMKDDLGFATVLTAYGLTESCGVVTMCRPDDTAETIATTAGRPIDGITLRLVDDQGYDVPDGEAGEIWVRGDCVMLEYLDEPELTTKAVDADGWLHTGDIAKADAQGNLRITGRKKDMFIVGGFNCYPAEIENLIMSHPAIAETAVIGMADERLGEVGVAFILPAAEVVLDATVFLAWCRETMANYKVPRRVIFVKNLPRNAAGKIDKIVLAEQLGGARGALG